MEDRMGPKRMRVRTIRFRIPTISLAEASEFGAFANDTAVEAAAAAATEDEDNEGDKKKKEEEEEEKKRSEEIIRDESDKDAAERGGGFRIPVVVITSYDDGNSTGKKKKKKEEEERERNLRLNGPGGAPAEGGGGLDALARRDEAEGDGSTASLVLPRSEDAYFPDEFVSFLGSCRGLMDGVWRSQHRRPIREFLDSIPPKRVADEGDDKPGRRIKRV